MADGSQHAFRFPFVQATSRLRPGEIVVDLFAGGGGASHALETALARPVDIAINHNAWAVAMHAANHPYTRHLCQDVWEADPRKEVAGRDVGCMHASPDCTHFSQAKGGQPRSRATRSLSWVVLRWAGTVRPRIITLENVHQILKWGPLVAKRCKDTGRVMRLDGSIAAPGERVPIDQQFLIPDKRHQGRTWRQFVAALRALGYAVAWKRLKACDYGAGTSRERLFLVARCDGQPIEWPEPTHGPGRAHSYVTAADCIDWSVPCPSIFERARPLADATLRRIARGLKRYVLDAAEPFITPAAGASNGLDHESQLPALHPVRRSMRASGRAAHAATEQALHPDAGRSAGGRMPSPGAARAPHATTGAGVPGGSGARQREAASAANITAAPTTAATPARPAGAAAALTAPALVQCANASASGIAAANDPLGTITAQPKGGTHALTTATLVQVAHGEGRPGGVQRWGTGARSVQEPAGTVTASGSGGYALASAALVKFRGNSDGADVQQPAPTITSGAGAARPAGAAHALGVLTAFLEQANGSGPNGKPARARAANEPVSAITATGSQQRLVTVTLEQRRCAGCGTCAPAAGCGDLCRDCWGALDDDIELLSADQKAGALRVAAFLINYYGNGQALDLAEPTDTITTRDRLALVTVTIRGTPYVIVDIGLRMLQRHELYRAQGFPADYIIDRTADGRTVSISRSVAMVGNSVSPPPLRAILTANLDSAEPALRNAA